MNTLLECVRDFGRRHGLWHPETRVVVALSGGADSVALLLILRDLASRRELVLDAAAHLHHGIRGVEADEDQAFCRALCARLEVPFVTASADVPARAGHDRTSIEVAARHARQEFLGDVRQSRRADAVATAHTENDQAETILLRLVRGVGGRGLAGIAPRRDGLIRPLLACTREELRVELQARGEAWREDATNRDLANPRNRVRHELLPYLEEQFNPSVARALARVADIARADEAWLHPMVDAASADMIRDENGQVSIDAARLNELPEGLARRVARRALEAASPGRSFSLDEADLVLAVAAERQAAAEFSSLRVERFRGSAVLIKKAASSRPRRRGMG